MSSKILISSNFLLSKIKDFGFDRDSYVEVRVGKDSIFIGEIGTLPCICRNEPATYNIMAESFLGLARLLKTVSDQPVTILFDGGMKIIVKDIIV